MWETVLKKDQEDRPSLRPSLQFIEEGTKLVDAVETSISTLKYELQEVLELIKTGGQSLRRQYAEGVLLNEEDFKDSLQDFEYAYEDIQGDCERLHNIVMRIAVMETDE